MAQYSNTSEPFAAMFGSWPRAEGGRANGAQAISVFEVPAALANSSAPKNSSNLYKDLQGAVRVQSRNMFATAGRQQRTFSPMFVGTSLPQHPKRYTINMCPIADDMLSESLWCPHACRVPPV